MMQKLLRDKRVLPLPTSTGARWWLRASSSSVPPGMHFSGKQRQQQEHKKYSQVHYYLEELTVNKEKNNFSIFKLRFRLFFSAQWLGTLFSLKKTLPSPLHDVFLLSRSKLVVPLKILHYSSKIFILSTRCCKDKVSIPVRVLYPVRSPVCFGEWWLNKVNLVFRGWENLMYVWFLKPFFFFFRYFLTSFCCGAIDVCTKISANIFKICSTIAGYEE